jgi:hypothetical protein
VYQNYSKTTRTEIRRLAIKEAIRLLQDDFYIAHKRELWEIEHGVYVICLSDPLAIQYKQGLSEIIYIGRGNVLGRLRSHYERSLFRLMQSLSGADFDFYIAEPKRNNASAYYKHVEHLLLETFAEKFGGAPYIYPLLNKNAGTGQNCGNGKGWDTPLKRTGKKPQWALQPTDSWNFEKLEDDE